MEKMGTALAVCIMHAAFVEWFHTVGANPREVFIEKSVAGQKELKRQEDEGMIHPLDHSSSKD